MFYTMSALLCPHHLCDEMSRAKWWGGVENQLLQGRLLPHERILWSGIPAQGLLFSGRDIFLIPFSLLWCGFAIFWTYMATKQGAPLFFDAWGAMFVCIGLFFVFGRFVFDAWLRRRIHYAVTNQRVLIMRQAPSANFTSIDLDRIPDVQLTGETATRGTLRFGAAASGYPLSGYPRMTGWFPALDPVPQFIGIQDPRRVFDLVMKTRHDSRR
ncbi:MULTISPECIES: PH domain-containing protein [unclassified Mesorhizobium]|uniref:PH domain-containing protein n=1 Tax=unclassified Mesorhizobium TaxID=325217 RepID=UPI000FD88EEE|nr:MULTISPECIES: PH domain-containing protein [unclassified Mesorhizobium]TGQ09929.1 PH domain-containing protein [Mesorhizobium sp. M2E.F.Ca.ET.219.01.1.1]TGT66388.1 PH domain-containing protein [Mesorhizobium sp. M2E.F.Ca.ET.166.01.1.1]TGV98143.1 PH domain-containing protein [Mesorhizobium sp. M2E.F.Ca.ET.154.01.1.1]